MTHAAESAAAPRNVAEAVVIKAGDVFLLSDKNGEVPLGNQDGFGLYYHDCRYLGGYRLRLVGTPLNALASSASQGFAAEFELTNEKLELNGDKSIAPQTFGIHLQRTIDDDPIGFQDVLTLRNYDVHQNEIELSVEFESHFESIFEIRGLQPKKVGREQNPKWRDDLLMLSYKGADGVLRRLEIQFDPAPSKTSGQSAQYDMKLAAGEQRPLRFSFRIIETKRGPGRDRRIRPYPHRVENEPTRKSHEWLSACAT